MPHEPSPRSATSRTRPRTLTDGGWKAVFHGVWGGFGALSLGVLMTACAGTMSRPGQTAVAGGPPNDPPLETIRGSLTTPEDSLVLDLLLGYRARTEGGGDAETWRRARNAQTQLDYMLRHGGVKNRGHEARVITIDGDRLTLEETVHQLSAALMRSTPGTAWRPEAERAREIQRRRPELSSLVEDAEWVLALTAALEGSLPADTKNHLRTLHQSYAARAPHADVIRQVNALLPAVTDESLRRELKKLANRSWDRERRDRDAPASRPVAPRPPAPASPSSPPTAPALPATPTTPATPATPTTPSLPASDPVPAAPPAPDPRATGVPDSGSTGAAPEVGATAERFCAERRADAALAFAQARAAADPLARTERLQRSLALLDECIISFPDSPEAVKARQNRDRVQQELTP